ncbi:MAG: hypothetical protein HYU37_03305 [Acidobacteria bacterium]|nr:hypothetical protein [Acidobacteriota bacterium]
MDVDIRALLIVVVFVAIYLAIPLGVLALYVRRVRRKPAHRISPSGGVENRDAGR